MRLVTPATLKLVKRWPLLPTVPFKVTVFVAEGELKAKAPEIAPTEIAPLPLLKLVFPARVRAPREIGALLVLMVPPIVVVLAVLVKPLVKLKVPLLPRVTPLLLLKTVAALIVFVPDPNRFTA